MRWLTRHAYLLLGVYVAVLAVVLLLPSGVLGSTAVILGVDILGRLGITDPMVTTRIEFAENVLLIAPLTFLASLIRPTYSWRDWTAFGFLLALGVETFQAVFLSGRSATFSDVVANALGALLGAVVARACSSRAAGRRGARVT